MSSTERFAEASPYTKGPQEHHHTDHRHDSFLVQCGLAERFPGKVIPDDLAVLNVALFALGRAGSIHLGNILRNPRLRLKYIVEADENKLKRVQKEWRLPDSALVTPAQDNIVFQDKSIHGIIVATPTSLHEGLVTRGLEAGKAVMCEKPISENYEGTKRCYQVAKKMGKPLLCAFNRRFEPSYLQLHDQVQKGVIGQVHMMKTVARDSPLPSANYLRISGGIFHDCAVHDIDLVCWVSGEYPTHAFASGSAFIPEIKDLKDQDTVAIVLKFPSGAMAMIDLSRNAVYGYDQRLEAFGPKGMLQAQNERPYHMVNSNVTGEHEVPINFSFPSRYYQGYENELEHFCNIMQGLEECCVSGDNTLRIQDCTL
ncbi:unnamed protein product [Meganyctiphanes norvegica]|uniref:Uncharacterized protein n=1 Tax=Meganyctiphanes norvegica TaxID=48144 RepID=A0AAV2Q5V1_MEGNR